MKRDKQQKMLFYTEKVYRHKYMEMKGVEERVGWLLAHEHATRNSDKHLLFLYWNFYDGAKKLDATTMQRITAAESITRARRKLQSIGLFPSSQIIKVGRTKSELAVRDYATS